jgi:hypothetical protein
MQSAEKLEGKDENLSRMFSNEGPSLTVTVKGNE